MDRIRFFKMEGAGNDYLYMDVRENPFDPGIVRGDVVSRLCDRRYGVGGDGLILIASSPRADARMWMWNSDGSSSAMCGNALRCVALYVSSSGNARRESVVVESGAGIHDARILLDQVNQANLNQANLNQANLNQANLNQANGQASVRLDMGSPVFDPERIPFRGSVEKGRTVARYLAKEKETAMLSEPGYVLSMGNPHCVFFVEDPDRVDLLSAGPVLEHSKDFPERTNVEFVSVKEDGTLYQRTWERGAGETLACGSGACAALVASVLAGKGPRDNVVHLRGGDLKIQWEENTVFMTGPARFVFSGELDPREFPLFR